MTIDPNTGAVRLHDHPTQQQIDAVYAWLHDDWHGILKSRFKWRILRPL